MKKYLVIGNPIDHSLSPNLHNYWIKQNNLDAIYNKKLLNEIDIKEIFNEVRNGKIDGINVTVPFKTSVFGFVDIFDKRSTQTGSINTISVSKGKVKGWNTDVMGFYQGLEEFAYPSSYFGKDQKIKILILGAGGVVSSIVIGLRRLVEGPASGTKGDKVETEIYISNRTRSKAIDMCKRFPELQNIEWSDKNEIIPEAHMIMNATSLGLKNEDDLEIDYAKVGKPKHSYEKKLFFDVIYNPSKTNFLKKAELLGHHIMNGMGMFISQAALSFFIWHGVYVKTSDKKILKKLLYND